MLRFQANRNLERTVIPNSNQGTLPGTLPMFHKG